MSRAVIAATVSTPSSEKEKMIDDQKRDYFLGPIRLYLSKTKFPMDAGKAKKRDIVTNSEDFEMDSEILYRKEEGKLLLAIPAVQRSLLLYAAHEDITSMHPGVTKTLMKLKEKYWFPFMAREVEKYISECLSCQQRKNPATARRVPLGTMMAHQP